MKPVTTGLCAQAGKAGGTCPAISGSHRSCLEFFQFLFVSKQNGIKDREDSEGCNKGI
jgi:hypothetical protein